jgi:hypothetical protein
MTTFSPHVFIPHANPERSLSCVKCGRPKEHPIHVDTTDIDWNAPMPRYAGVRSLVA